MKRIAFLIICISFLTINFIPSWAAKSTDNVGLSITKISGTLSGNKLRITINASSPIGEYTESLFDNSPRLAIDIENAVYAASDIKVNSNYVYKVRGAQYTSQPYVTRIVCDMKEWTGYTVSLSTNKKQMFIDFDNKPLPVSRLGFERTPSSDNVSLDMKYARNAVIVSSGNNQLVMDVPMTSVDLIDKYTSTYGRFVNSIQCKKTDNSTSRFIFNLSGQSFAKVEKADSGIKVIFSATDSTDIKYSVVGYPQFTIKNEEIGINYFEYRYKKEQGRFVLTIPTRALDFSLGRMIVNDYYMDYIDFKSSPSTGLTDITFYSKNQYDFKVDTTAKENTLTASGTAASLPAQTSNGGLTLNPIMLGKTIVVDPGHGGEDNGATYPTNPAKTSDIKVKEKDINLDIAGRLSAMLIKAGLNVQMTRQGDETVDLYQRGDFANKLNAVLYLSVHNNSGNTEDNGTMTLFYPSDYPGYGLTGERFAQIAEEEMLSKLGTANRGIWKRPRLAVLNNTHMPAIITETAYISNSDDRSKLLTEAFRQKTAEALYNAVVKALNEMAVSNTSSITQSTSTATQPTYNSQDYLPGTINGFTVPPKAASKCSYVGNSEITPSMYDLSINLDYSKEKQGLATLADQKSEARAVLLSKLDEATVNKIMYILYGFTDNSSAFYEEELGNSEYEIWARSIRYSGIATINIIKR